MCETKGVSAVEDKVAIVTGASRGIGRATAAAIARRGVRVMAVARSEDELRSLAEAEGVEYLVASVEDVDTCEQIVRSTRERLGPIDILVNNAGIDTNEERPIWAQDSQVWRRTLAVNLDAPFHLTRLAAPDMIDRGWGRVIMVSSTAGSVGGPSMSAYCASKSGLEGLTRAVAHDIASSGVTCNAVAPGWVRTPMAERSAQVEADERGVTVDRIWQERAALYPTGRVVEPEEVADVIAFLASEQASAINGEVIRLAHGGSW
jgi:NAD(P)-dependent dehydrogenase (short-subunit alcohol dehydrogenase family)